MFQHSHTGLRAPEAVPCRCRPFSSQPATQRWQRRRLAVTAQKSVKKIQEVVLKKAVPNIGAAGELTKVRAGYFRNYLAPQGLATRATENVLRQIQDKIKAQEVAAEQVRSKAAQMATALQTIGKFVVKRKTSKDRAQIFGSVGPQDVVDAVERQTGRQLDKNSITLPAIKEVGAYDVTVQLHPDVIGRFRLIVEREKIVT